jgi:hypothetical protein
MAQKIGASGYLECSSLKNEGLNIIFETATKVVLFSDHHHDKKRSNLKRFWKGFLKAIGI